MNAFLTEIGNLIKFRRLDLLEKDILLHRILLTLSEDNFLANNLLFKGGTCLIKSYLGYYRFSEDLDFTWRDQKIFEGMSSKKIRRYLSNEIYHIGGLLEKISTILGVKFLLKKDDRRYVELGGSNKMVTFKVWFDSSVLKYESFIKIQINFVDKLSFPPNDQTLNSLISAKEFLDLSLMFPEEYSMYSKIIPFLTYDIREILCEKIRSILTRKGIKTRDFVDIFLIIDHYNLELSDYKDEIVTKTLFVLDLYEKYRENLRNRRLLISSDDFFEWGSERELLLREIPEVEFYKFMKNLLRFLDGILLDIGEV